MHILTSRTDKILEAIVLVVMAAKPLPGFAQDALEPIAKAWRDRESKYRSARFEWKNRHTVPRGQFTDMVARFPGSEVRLKSMGIERDAVVPPRDTTYEFRASCSVAGAKLRYEHDNHQWSAAKQSYVPMPYVGVFDGKIAKVLHTLGSTYTHWPDALVYREAKHPDRDNLNLLPLLMHYRGVNPELRPYSIETMTVGGLGRAPDGSDCLELTRDLNGAIQRFWVDPMREYSVVGYLLTVKDRPMTKIAIRYRNDSGHGWVLAAWELSSFQTDGRLTYSTHAQVTQVELNIDLPNSEFDVEFPPGTLVTDEKSKTTYIVNADNSQRQIQPSEIQLSYDQLISSTPPQSLIESARPWITGGLITACVAIAMILLLRRSKILKSTQGGEP